MQRANEWEVGIGEPLNGTPSAAVVPPSRAKNTHPYNQHGAGCVYALASPRLLLKPGVG